MQSPCCPGLDCCAEASDRCDGGWWPDPSFCPCSDPCEGVCDTDPTNCECDCPQCCECDETDGCDGEYETDWDSGHWDCHGYPPGPWCDWEYDEVFVPCSCDPDCGTDDDDCEECVPSGTVTITKTMVNNNGGTADSADFHYFVNDVEVALGVPVDLVAGPFLVTETGPDGYSASFSADCSGTVGGAVGDDDFSGDLLARGGDCDDDDECPECPPPEVYACEITNDDIPPSLELVKVVVNDHGGVLTAGAWTLSADGPTDISGPGGATSGPLFEAGIYALSEGSVVPGAGDYSTGPWQCVGGTQNDSSITLDIGESAVCTIINDDPLQRLPGTGEILVYKVIDPTSDTPPGGESFPFTSSWGDFNLAGGGMTSSGPLDEGIYSVAEGDLPEGWSLVSGECSEGTPGSINLGAEEVVTCTFTNRYDEPEGGESSLTINKVGVLLPGEDADTDASFAFVAGESSFSLGVGGSQSIPVELGEEGTATIVVTESYPGDWVLSDVECSGAVSTERSGDSVSVVVGVQEASCTFTNTQTATAGPGGSLTIQKVTGPAGGTGFSFDAGDLGTFSLDDGGSQQFDLEAGSYTVTELPSEELALTSVVCTALDYVVDLAAGSVTVNLAEGEAALCTFTNGALPFTGSESMMTPLLIAGLWTILMGLALAVWSWMREADKA